MKREADFSEAICDFSEVMVHVGDVESHGTRKRVKAKAKVKIFSASTGEEGGGSGRRRGRQSRENSRGKTKL